MRCSWTDAPVPSSSSRPADSRARIAGTGPSACRLRAESKRRPPALLEANRMDLDGLGSLFLLLLHWRVLAWLLASTLVSVVLVHAFPWFTGLQGVLLVVFGVVAGIASEAAQESAEKPAKEAAPAPVWAVALAAAFCGALWGGASSGSAGSFLAGAVLWTRVAGGGGFGTPSVVPPNHQGVPLSCMACSGPWVSCWVPWSGPWPDRTMAPCGMPALRALRAQVAAHSHQGIDEHGRARLFFRTVRCPRLGERRRGIRQCRLREPGIRARLLAIGVR
jgi:hypothetical protein